MVPDIYVQLATVPMSVRIMHRPGHAVCRTGKSDIGKRQKPGSECRRALDREKVTVSSNGTMVRSKDSILPFVLPAPRPKEGPI